MIFNAPPAQYVLAARENWWAVLSNIRIAGWCGSFGSQAEKAHPAFVAATSKRIMP